MPLTVGTRLGSYEIQSLIGAGGMGEVYRARDTKLGREVALKVLPPAFSADPDRLHRFEQEARAAAALNHPNIVTIHSVEQVADVHFITMELVEGKTLAEIVPKNGLPLGQMLKLAVPLADAVSSAHQRGITHRDLKPANVMVNEERRVKVLDFGLAKLREEPTAAAALSALPTAPLTGEGHILGTVAYMSPEQAEGRRIDHRSDIFSLGIILFEMATGEPPFKGDSTMSLLSSIIKDNPPLVTEINQTLPPELARIIRRALVKDPEHRYQTAKDLRNDLEELMPATPSREVVAVSTRGEASASRGREPSDSAIVIGVARRHRGAVLAVLAALVLLAAGVLGGRAWFTRAPAGEAIDSVAVLPFVNASGNPDSEYLSDGLGDTIINNLSQLEGLRVVPRTLVATYKGKAVDLKQAARDLNVRALVTGRVVQRGDTLSVQTELVDVETLSQLWGEQYSRKLADMLSVQEEISRAVAEKLRTRLTREDEGRLARQKNSSSEAYQVYLKGRYELNKRSNDALKNATAYFEQAIARDPTYALAYSGLADTYSQRAIWGYLPSSEAFPKAGAAAKKAVELDDRVAEAHASLGLTSLMYEWNWSKSEQELRRALALDPNNADAHRWYDGLLGSRRRFDEAIAEARRAQALDPLSPINSANLGLMLAWARRPNDAIDVLKKVLEVEPDFIAAHLYLGMAYGYRGLTDLAIAESRRLIELGSPPGQFLMAMSYAAAGRKAEALKALNAVIPLSARLQSGGLYIAATYALMHDSDKALSWLEEAYKQHDPNLVFLKVQPEFDSLHSDPRFQDLVRRIGIPSS